MRYHTRYSGSISLFNNHGICLSSCRYGSRAQRQHFINRWHLLFKKGMPGYFIHVSPDTKDEDITLPKKKNLSPNNIRQ